MLTLYRRHQPPCAHTSRRNRKCTCPIWVQGSFRGEYIRQSLDLRSWEAASDLIHGWEASGELGVVKPEVPAIAEAVRKFFDDATARHLEQPTIGRTNVIAEPLGEHGAIDATGRNVQDDTLLVFDGRLDLEAVEDQERLHRRVADTLVAIKERVVSDDRETARRPSR